MSLVIFFNALFVKGASNWNFGVFARVESSWWVHVVQRCVEKLEVKVKEVRVGLGGWCKSRCHIECWVVSSTESSRSGDLSKPLITLSTATYQQKESDISVTVIKKHNHISTTDCVGDYVWYKLLLRLYVNRKLSQSDIFLAQRHFSIFSAVQFGFLTLLTLVQTEEEEELRPALFLTLFPCGL